MSKPKQSQQLQLRVVAEANGWIASYSGRHSDYVHVHSFRRGVEFISIRTGRNGQLVGTVIEDGSGVLFTPRTGKFREVCVALSAKAK